MEKNNSILIKNIFRFLKNIEINCLKHNILKNIKSQEKHYDIIRQKITEVNIPIKSARRAAIRIKRVFFTLIALV